VISKAEQTNDHNNEQEEVCYKSSDVGHFGGLDVERHALVSGIIPCFADLLKT
jgi:hypothetical protein